MMRIKDLLENMSGRDHFRNAAAFSVIFTAMCVLFLGFYAHHLRERCSCNKRYEKIKVF